jgi:hypothetical protein
MHVPFMHVPLHEAPHAPQWAGSELVSVHEALQHDWLFGQEVPHAPQFAMSLVVSVHLPWQHDPEGHALPQLPQLFESV